MLQLIKQHKTLAQTPVVCMSASNSQEQRDRTKREGSTGFISKPLRSKSLSKEIETFLLLMNDANYSKNGRIAYHVVFNDNEKNILINTTIENSLKQKNKVMILSWQRGDDFFEHSKDYKKNLETDEIKFYEIKPNLISKFPYLQDLSCIPNDMELLAGENTREYHLIFDEPAFLFPMQKQEKAINQAYNFSRAIHPNFSKVTYINRRESRDEQRTFMTKLGQVFTGNRGSF
jgi:CheY-like chemotaxis protein